MLLKISLHGTLFTIISCYAPTLVSEPDEKDKFYSDLATLIRDTPPNRHLLILGDFNARTGSNHHAWTGVLGMHGTGQMNDNGQRLLELCARNNLCLPASFFAGPMKAKVTWKNPRSGRWHQLDHISVRQSCILQVTNCWSLHSADCDTDHALVHCRLKIVRKKTTHTAKTVPKA